MKPMELRVIGCFWNWETSRLQWMDPLFPLEEVGSLKSWQIKCIMSYMKATTFLRIFTSCSVHTAIKFLWHLNSVLGRGMINIMREGKIRREMERSFPSFVVTDKQ